MASCPQETSSLVGKTTVTYKGKNIKKYNALPKKII